MPQQNYLDDLWRRHDNFKFDAHVQAEEHQENSCVYAQQFMAWFQRTCQDAIDKPDVIAINQAKIRLVDHYFELREYVPRPHRYRVGERGHSCIYHIFDICYASLRLAECNLVKPTIFILEKPAPPQEPPPPFFDDVIVNDPQ